MFTILYVFLKAYSTLDHKTLMFRHNNNNTALIPNFLNLFIDLFFGD